MDKDKKDIEHEKELLKPDPETLHTTDPQEHMEGPVSSLVNKAGEVLDPNEKNKGKDEVNKEENGE